MSFGSVPTSSSNVPLGSVYPPNTSGSDLIALEGGPISTDSNNQKSAPVSMYVKDGSDVTQGTSTDGNTANTVMGRLTKIRDVLLAGVAVTGTFWQSVQPVSGTFWQATQPVSASSLPLPTGASTAAKQPALGTAGSAASDVLSVQGITSMTPLKTDNSGVTQPVSGTVTANAGTNLNTSTLALETGGHLATIDTSTAAAKTDLDTIVTNTNKIPASPAQEAGNLATLVTNTADLLADGDHLATIDSGIATLVTNTADLLADGDNLATIATNTTSIATAANQATANTSLASIKTDLDTLVTNTADLLADGDNLATIQTNTANIPAKGAAVISASTPVNIASDQTVPTKNPTWTNIYTTTQTGVSSWAGSGDLSISQYGQFIINIQISAITGTSIQFITKRKDSFGNYYSVDSPPALTSTGGQNRSIGLAAGANVFLGATAQLTVTLVAITTVSFTVDIWAR